MKLSLGISACVHAIVLTALVFLFQAVPKMRLPEGVYSVKILQPFVGAGPSAGAKTEEGKKDAVKVEEPKQEPKKEEAKIPVPKKPDATKEGDAKKAAEAKKEASENGAGEKPLGVSVGAGAGDGTGIAVDAASFPFGYFLAAIERRVSENWFSAVSEGGTGLTCVVYFRLMRDGSASDARIETSSGNAYFDRAAVRAVKSAAPFPPLPRAFTDAFLGIHFTFVQKD
ncbi:MAG: TonB family protein [Candidatus Krumholzibacteria bacterium]|nr:TonB family protein [Candidatus Krumholzibacteria bacterium]